MVHARGPRILRECGAQWGLTVGSKCGVQGDQDAGRNLEPLPAPIKDVLGYEFFTYKDGAPLEFDEAYGQEYKQLYNTKVASSPGS